MTRLSQFELAQVRGSDPDPIPFPTQFCNMIYLQYFNSEFNNFSGFKRSVLVMIKRFHFLQGQIPVDLTKLKCLRDFDLTEEPLLEGLLKKI